MTKFFVKKPYFVLVAVIIILIIGGVSLGNMNTDLMPNMEVDRKSTRLNSSHAT